MRWTEDDLNILRANPNITVLQQGGAKTNDNDVPKKTSPKYRNKRVYLYGNGIVVSQKDEKFGALIASYDSEKEYSRHCELLLLEQTGHIIELKRQVPIKIQDKFLYHGAAIKEISYKADFMYMEGSNKDCIIVEDVKGYDEKTGKYLTTKDFDLKWKLLKCRYPDFDFRVV